MNITKPFFLIEESATELIHNYVRFFMNIFYFKEREH